MKFFSTNIDVKDHINALRTFSSRESNPIKYNQTLTNSNQTTGLVMMKLKEENVG